MNGCYAHAELDGRGRDGFPSSHERDCSQAELGRGMVVAWRKPLKRRPNLHIVLGNQTMEQVKESNKPGAVPPCFWSA